MNAQEERRFESELRRNVDQARKELRYPATIFVSELEKHGAFKAAQRLLERSPTDGFTTLLLARRLDLSLEAVAIKPEWRRFFNPALISRIEKLLKESDFEVPEIAEDVAFDSEGRGRRGKLARSFSGLCAELGAPLANIQDRWCGVSSEKRLAVFTVWADRLKDGKYVFLDGLSPDDRRIGAIELRRVIETVKSEGYAAYGILCEAKDVSADPRARGYFDEENLLVLSFVDEAPGTVAYVIGEVHREDVKSRRAMISTKFQSAADDLDPPSGVVEPERTSGIVTGYRRDRAVRAYVLDRAKGRCEYCDAPGFELPGGNRYVEAHHVIALSADGPDTVHNVIALCASHHREAHFGKDRADLARRLLARIAELNGSSNRPDVRSLR